MAKFDGYCSREDIMKMGQLLDSEIKKEIFYINFAKDSDAKYITDYYTVSNR